MICLQKPNFRSNRIYCLNINGNIIFTTHASRILPLTIWIKKHSSACIHSFQIGLLINLSDNSNDYFDYFDNNIQLLLHLIPTSFTCIVSLKISHYSILPNPILPFFTLLNLLFGLPMLIFDLLNLVINRFYFYSHSQLTLYVSYNLIPHRLILNLLYPSVLSKFPSGIEVNKNLLCLSVMINDLFNDVIFVNNI